MAANDVRMISFCAAETNTRMVDVVPDMHVMRTRVDFSDVCLSVLSPQLSGVGLLVFFFETQCTQSEFVARPPHSLWSDREKKSGQRQHLPTAIAAVPGTEKTKKTAVQPRAATRGPHLPRIPQVLRHRSRALPTILEVAEFVATAGILGPQIRWSSPCWRAHL